MEWESAGERDCLYKDETHLCKNTPTVGQVRTKRQELRCDSFICGALNNQHFKYYQVRSMSSTLRDNRLCLNRRKLFNKYNYNNFTLLPID